MALFLSHRGESDDAPENTLSAFQLAMDRNSDGVELDIRRTSDGQTVVIHDEDLLRVAGKPLKIHENTFELLRNTHPVPLLSEVLDILKNGIVQIEIKGDDLNLLPALKKILEESPVPLTKIFLSSFEEKTIIAAEKVFPDLPRLILTDLKKHFGTFPSAEDTAGYLKKLRCTGISFKADTDASEEFVRNLHDAGYRVVCWGISSDPLGLAMAEIGVDAMTCNHAVALREKAGSCKSPDESTAPI